jgi:hypothetical protein
MYIPCNTKVFASDSGSRGVDGLEHYPKQGEKVAGWELLWKH